MTEHTITEVPIYVYSLKRGMYVRQIVNTLTMCQYGVIFIMELFRSNFYFTVTATPGQSFVFRFVMLISGQKFHQVR